MFNRALEIYNGGDEVDLSEFSISGYNGGVPTVLATYTLSGTLNAGEVYVIANLFAASGIRNQRDVAYFAITNFDGGHAIALLHNGVIVDFIGDNNGVDPGIGWDVAGTTEATANHTLVRKPRVTEGNPTPRKSFGTNAHNSEWIVYPENEFSYLGSHCNAPSTQATSVAFGDTDHYFYGGHLGERGWGQLFGGSESRFSCRCNAGLECRLYFSDC